MDSSDDIIEYRIDRSYESVQEAILLKEAGHYNSAISRLYYAAFYSVSALLYKFGLYSKTHSGLKSLFHEHIIKTRKLNNDDTKIYKQLFDYRQDGDYGDFITFTEQEVNILIKRTQTFINEIKKLI